MGSRVYIHGKEIENPHEFHHHVAPKKQYLVVLGSLLVLTILTVAVSYADLGPLSLPVAMLLAVIKASLVCAFFMHLKDDDRFNVFIFMGTLIFVGIFFGFTLFDLDARNAINDEQKTFNYWNDEAAAGNPLKLGIDHVPEKAAALKAAHGGHGAGHGDAAEGGHEADAKAGHEPEAGHADEAKAGHADEAKAGHDGKAAPEAGHPPAPAGH